jgi:hypothetical protein
MRIEQRAVITHVICVQLVKTLTESKKKKKERKMEGSEKYRMLSISWVYKWHKRFSEGICDINGAEKSGRPPLSKNSAKSHIPDIITTD